MRDLEARVLAEKAEILDEIADLQAMLKKNKHGHFGRDAYDIKEQIDALKEEWKSILQAARDEFGAIQSASLADWESDLASTRN